MEEEQQYSYFLYILFFQFASINDQPYIYIFFQVLTLIPLEDFQTQALIKSNLIFAYSGDRKGISLSILYAVHLITEYLCPQKEL